MRSKAVQVGIVGRARSLYLVPERRVERERHIPAGRSLHLVDLENLIGGPCRGRGSLAEGMASYCAAAPVQLGDHVVVAVNPGLALDAGLVWRTARLLSRSGPDGADQALLEQISDRSWIAARYDRIIIGSGDGIFASAAADLRALGIAVGVIAPANALSRQLRRVASFIRYVSTPDFLHIVA